MSRLDGQKKSPLPLIIGLLAGFAAGAGGYTFYAQNIATDTTTVEQNTPDNATNSVQEYNRAVAPGDASVKSDSESAPATR